MKMTLETAFHVYSNKGPVNHESSQRAAWGAYYEIKDLLTKEEIDKLSIARGHATFCGEGRGEFDRVCKEIKERLVKEKILND